MFCLIKLTFDSAINKVINCHCIYTAFGLDFYTEVMDLSYLTEHIPDSPFFRKYKKLNEALIGLVEDYSLVSFIPLNVQVKIHVSLFLYCAFTHV